MAGLVHITPHTPNDECDNDRRPDSADETLERCHSLSPLASIARYNVLSAVSIPMTSPFILLMRSSVWRFVPHARQSPRWYCSFMSSYSIRTRLLAASIS